MNRFLLFCCVLVLPLLGFSQQSNYSRVRIYLDGKDVKALMQTGIEPTGFDRKNETFTSELSQAELKAAFGLCVIHGRSVLQRLASHELIRSRYPAVTHSNWPHCTVASVAATRA